MISGLKTLRGIGLVTLYLACCIFSIQNLSTTDLWPNNHEGNSFFTRTLLYSDHFKQGDFFPIWSGVDNGQFGSPLPALYHKVFYYVSGSIHVITDNVKFSVVLSIVLFMLIGALGTFFLAQSMGLKTFQSVASGIGLIFANYTVTNWLVRGAMAEFSGAMIIPFLLTVFARDLTRGKFRLLTGLVAGSLFLAHSVMAYFVFLIVTMALILVISFTNYFSKSDLINLFKSMYKPSIGFLMFSLPYLLATFHFSKEYSISRITPEGLRPRDQFRPFITYIWDKNYTFGKDFTTLTTQIDTAVILVGLI